jgi:glutathione S-transferase
MQNEAGVTMTKATLTIASKNYGSWSLRGWLMCRMAGLEFEERTLPADDPETRAELLLLSPSFQVPCLEHEGVKVWDTLAIAEYLAEIRPKAGLLPTSAKARAHCRSICGEMHSGFANMRSSMPMNIKARHPGYKIFAGARPDVNRIAEIWNDCLERYGGPFLFGEPTMADAMYAPVTTRFATYDVHLEKHADGYCRTITAWPLMQEWVTAALAEPDDLEELDVEF